jgi:hypothetical protein
LKKVNERSRELFIRYCNKTPEDKFVPPKNLCNKSGKWKDIMNGVKKQLNNDNARIKELLAKELGEVAVGGRQTSLADCRGK